MKKLGIISAFHGELKPLVDGWSALGSSPAGQAAWRGRVGSIECFAVSGGMGSRSAARACAVADSAADGLDGMVSLGWAGALSCGVHPARAYRVAEVVDAETGERFVSSGPPSTVAPLGLVTVGHVAQAGEKRALAARYHAVLVDMEAAAVARIARDKGIVFYCFKAVSDALGEVLPDFSNYADRAGQMRMPALLAHLAIRPGYWPAMARMRKNTKTGASALAIALDEFLQDHADNLSR